VQLADWRCCQVKTTSAIWSARCAVRPARANELFVMRNRVRMANHKPRSTLIYSFAIIFRGKTFSANLKLFEVTHVDDANRHILPLRLSAHLRHHNIIAWRTVARRETEAPK